MRRAQGGSFLYCGTCVQSSLSGWGQLYFRVSKKILATGFAVGERARQAHGRCIPDTNSPKVRVTRGLRRIALSPEPPRPSRPLRLRRPGARRVRHRAGSPEASAASRQASGFDCAATQRAASSDRGKAPEAPADGAASAEADGAPEAGSAVVPAQPESSTLRGQGVRRARHRRQPPAQNRRARTRAIPSRAWSTGGSTVSWAR